MLECKNYMKTKYFHRQFSLCKLFDVLSFNHSASFFWIKSDALVVHLKKSLRKFCRHISCVADSATKEYKGLLTFSEV